MNFRTFITRSVLGILLLLSLLITGYILFLCYPQAAFPHRYEQGNILLYSDQALDDNWRNILVGVQRRLERSTAYEPERKYQVFFCKRKELFRRIAFFQPQAVGVNNALFNGNSFIRAPDETNDRIPSPNGRGNVSNRSLTDIVAHEITHTMLAQGVSRFAYLTAEPWVIEGYCDYIGTGLLSNVRQAQLKRQYEQGEIRRRLDWYDLYHLTVEFYLEKKGRSFKALVGEKIPVKTAIDTYLRESYHHNSISRRNGRNPRCS